MTRWLIATARALLAAGMMAGMVAGAAPAGPLTPRPGWEVIATRLDYPGLLARLRRAIRAEGFGLVTEAGPTEAARSRGIAIPGNRVLGVFRNDYAVRILRLSTAAMIEAPIRFYVTENPDGTATLAWKRPSHVLAPYLDEGGAELARAAEELDAAFAAIAARALR
ncbi:MAG: hypothetical protein KatS3mg118_0663 [Paracoccaceae bacterium]|nr:MAG: hypothetical protein KatS3mg118_0663 [Paracoccaceae bacterium]